MGFGIKQQQKQQYHHHEQQLQQQKINNSNKFISATTDQAGIFPANPRTLFVGNSQSHRKS